MSQTRIEYAYNRMLQDMLPKYYADYVESRQHLATSDKEFARLYDGVSCAHSQAFINIATYGLDEWEKVFGLPYIEGLSYEARRRRINALLAGTGTSTVANLEAMLNELVGVTDAHIEEHNEDYYFNVMLPLGDGELSLDEVDRLLAMYAPAHLGRRMTTSRRDKVRLGTVAFTGEQVTVYPITVEDISVKSTYSSATGSYMQEITAIMPQQ